MDDNTRSYRSILRDDQARATRRRIVEAARVLFLEHGYAGTTIDAIAARAKVSRKTVFTSVGGKVAALKLAWDWTLAGDDEPVAIADRPAARRIVQMDDPVRLLTEWTALQAGIATRLAPLYHVIGIAADGDADAAALRDENEGYRMDGALRLAQQLAGLKALRRGLNVERASQIAALLMDPVPAGRLVHDAGWSVDDYAALLARTGRAALLRD